MDRIVDLAINSTKLSDRVALALEGYDKLEKSRGSAVCCRKPIPNK
jgi:hypothetical protein